MADYIYDAEWESERARLAGLEAALDPGTTRHMIQLGIEPGWRCLEVGAGGGSIPAWMCERVGSTGRVVATDLDPRFVSAVEADNLEILTHNAVTDDFESSAFDLVHSRDVLEHIPERLDVLDKLVDAAAPGGWVFVEDVDFAPELVRAGFGLIVDDPDPFVELWDAVIAWMHERGVDPTFGRALPGELRARGLEQIGGEVSARVLNAEHPASQLPKLSLQHLGPPMVAAGSITQEQIDMLSARFEDPDLLMYSPLHVSAWGRKPA